jgi:plastocyanin
MKACRILFLLPACLAACATTEMSDMSAQHSPDYLPHGDTARTLIVTNAGPASANIIVLTEAVAIKETGPQKTVRRFGEVYAFAPSFFAVHRDEPTLIRFWNLQADDEHDLMLLDPRNNVLMKITLPPLQETAYVFTFHEEGLFPFICAMHRPAMNGQILVLPPASADPSHEHGR